jgi:hypothetical protein
MEDHATEVGMQKESRNKEARSALFAGVWAYLDYAAAKVREDGEETSEGVARYVEGVLVPFIEGEGRAALVQEGKATLAQEEAELSRARKEGRE